MTSSASDSRPSSGASRRSSGASSSDERMSIRLFLNDEPGNEYYHHSECRELPHRPAPSTIRPSLPPIREILHADLYPPRCAPVYYTPRPAQPQRPPPASRENSSRSRAPRLRYSPEEMFFVWYHRTDLELPWSQVKERFRQRWPQSERSQGGLTCKFYRVLDFWGIETIREQNRKGKQAKKGDRVPKYGLVDRTSERFPWMRPEDYYRAPLPEFKQWHHREEFC